MPVSGQLGEVPGHAGLGEGQSPRTLCRPCWARKNIDLSPGSSKLLLWCLCQLQLRH